MTVSRGEIWLADLNPARGSEQSGTRPVLIFQNNSINRFTSTCVTIPLTTNLRGLHYQRVQLSLREKAVWIRILWLFAIS
jgi:mRNA-degrading endonuclease toxin of MazEF toxin-antitoxin module